MTASFVKPYTRIRNITRWIKVFCTFRPNYLCRQFYVNVKFQSLLACSLWGSDTGDRDTCSPFFSHGFILIPAWIDNLAINTFIVIVIFSKVDELSTRGSVRWSQLENIHNWKRPFCKIANRSWQIILWLGVSKRHYFALVFTKLVTLRCGIYILVPTM